MSNTIYPLALNNNNKLTSVGYWKPLFLFNIPANTEHATVDWIFPDRTVKPMMQFTFYCDSIRKDSVVDLNTFNDPDVDSSGCGSREKPWKDLNYALECIQCFARTVCDGDFAFRLILTGEVNYAIGSANRHINGYGRVLVDCTDAIFALDVDIQAAASDGYAFRFLCGISFSGIVEATYKVSAYGNIDFAVISDCNMCVFDMENLKVEIPVNETKYPAAQTVLGALRCSSCRIRCATAEFDTQHVVIGAGSWQVFGFNNNQCEFTDVDVSMAVSAASNSSKVSQDLVACYGFYANTDCVFDGCTATSVAVSASPGTDNIAAYGCGWDENNGSIWIGRNIGFCRYYENGDTTNESALVYVPECTLNSDCETPLTPPSSSSSEEPPPPDSFKGSVACHAFTRSISYRLWATAYSEDTVNGKQDCYVVSVGFNWEHRCGSSSDAGWREFAEVEKFHGFIGRLDCDKDECYDENDNAYPCWLCWGECGCEEGYFYANDGVNYYEKPASLANSAATSANSDVTKWINGTLYELPDPEDIPFDKSGWFGFKNYCRSGSLTHISPHTLYKKGDTLTAKTKTEASFYSNWGGYPCSDGDGSVNIELETYVFEWRPDDDNDTQKPKYLILEDAEGNEIRCEFMKEYCLQGNTDIDRDMVSLVTCSELSGVDNDFYCNYVIVKGTTRLYDTSQPGVEPGIYENYQKPTRTLSRTYKYKGVK